MITDKITLTYFDIRGRMEPVRLLLEDANLPYDDRRRFDWKTEKMNKIKHPFGQLPAMYVGDVYVVQGDAILRYLAREAGYYGKTNLEAMNIDMIAGAVEDIKVPYARVIYGGDFDKAKIEFVNVKVPEWLANINLFIQRFSNGQRFIAGDSISFADFLMYEMLTVLTYLDSNILVAFPVLNEYAERMEARDNIAAYLKSGRRPAKVNGVVYGTPAEMLKKTVE